MAMTNKKAKPKGLGRGLDALFGEEAVDDKNVQVDELSIDRLRAGRYQPRMHMDDVSLAELADSIREEGVISPIIVRPLSATEYEIIAGERRFRAAKIAGLSTVPVIVREVDDERAMAMALIENIQREDLNPMEEAMGIERLVNEFHYTHERAAKAIGRSRSATTNLLRLLSLVDEVKNMLMSGTIEMGHARALLALDGVVQVTIAKEVVNRCLSVRQTEELVKRALKQGSKKIPPRVVIKTRDNERLEESLAETLGTVVKLSANPKGKGKIVIEFADLDQLQGIVEHIQRDAL